MGIIPCDQVCEKCKYPECILTDEQIDAMADISPQLNNYYLRKEKYKVQQSAYKKEYYKTHKEQIKARVKAHREANREHYRQYERDHPRKRDRKEYMRQYYLKKKGIKDVKTETTVIVADDNITSE